MKVKFIKKFCPGRRTFVAGQEYDVADRDAALFIRDGIAVAAAAGAEPDVKAPDSPTGVNVAGEGGTAAVAEVPAAPRASRQRARGATADD